MDAQKPAIFLIFTLLSLTGTNSFSYYTENDLSAFRKVFQNALKTPFSDDLGSLHHAIEGLIILDGKLDGIDKNALCNHFLKKVKSEQQSLDAIYHAASVSKVLSQANCKINDVPQVMVALKSFAANDGHSAQDLYYLAKSHDVLGGKLDAGKLEKGLIEAIKKDDSAAALGYALHAATFLEAKKADQFMSHIDDLVQQADEVGDTFLQFEGGLSVTAIAIHSMYSLAMHVGKVPNIPADRAVKFTNYLLSRKSVRVVRPAKHLLAAVQLLTDNKYHLPVSMTLQSPMALTPTSNVVTLKLCNLLGHSVGPLTVTLDSAVHVKSGATVLNKVALKDVKGDTTSTLYQLDFFQSSPSGGITPGFYKLTIQAGSATDKRLIGVGGVNFNVKVMREITVENVEIQTPDRDHAQSKASAYKMNPGTKFGQAIEADYHQKLVMKFTVKDKSGPAVNVHQAFVRFSHVKTDQEIIFVAEPENDKEGIYKFDVDLRSKGREFNYMSGNYRMHLILGDAIVSNPMDWYMADLKLHFSEEDSAQFGKQSDENAEEIRAAKTPIEHTFREKDKRAPTWLSDAFTIACLAPLLLLPILMMRSLLFLGGIQFENKLSKSSYLKIISQWLRVGINFGNMPTSIFTLGFHIGLACVLGLYTCFWLKLNMFETLKYLLLLGGVTFVCGNRMLRAMAERRKPKTE